MKVDKARLRAELSRPMSDAEYAQIFRPALARSLLDEIERLRNALGFASSVIKSGEPWTGTCERVIGAALSDGDTDA